MKIVLERQFNDIGHFKRGEENVQSVFNKLY